MQVQTVMRAVAGKLLWHLPRLTVPFELQRHLIMSTLGFVDALCSHAKLAHQGVTVQNILLSPLLFHLKWRLWVDVITMQDVDCEQHNCGRY